MYPDFLRKCVPWDIFELKVNEVFKKPNIKTQFITFKDVKTKMFFSTVNQILSHLNLAIFLVMCVILCQISNSIEMHSIEMDDKCGMSYA